MGDFKQLEKYFMDLDSNSLVEGKIRKEPKGDAKEWSNYISNWNVKPPRSAINRKKRYSTYQRDATNAIDCR